MADPIKIDADKSTWARYAEGTAGRDPMKFLAQAIEQTAGEEGDGRLAIDLGSGAGNETLALLERGWKVHAVDSEPRAIEMLESRVDETQRSRLTTQVGAFDKAALPLADLVFASLSLPFAGDSHDLSVQRALNAVKPGGWFVGVLFGHNDTWSSNTEVSSVDRGDIAALFTGFDPVEIDEEEFDGSSSIGEKHWHWYVVSAHRPGSS
jgi:SAM-dependent methyltransferase